MRSMKLATALAAIALVAAACSSSATTAPSAAPATAAPATAAPATEAPSMAPSEAPSMAPSAAAPSAAALTGSLTLWNAYSGGGTAEGKAFAEVLAAVQAANPGLTLNVLDVPFSDLFTKFETEAAAGGGPDMYIGPNDNFGNEVRAGLLADTGDVSGQFVPQTVQVAIDGSQVDGKYYTIPESLKAVAMFYNKDKVATPPATTDELLAAVKSGVKVGINQGAYHNWGFWYAFGGQIMDGTGKCVADATSGVSDALTYLKALKDAGATFYTDGAKMEDAFKTQKLDAMIDGPWFTGDAKAAYGDKLGVAPGPAQADAFKPMTGVDGWYINASSPNVALAKQLALVLTDQASQQIMVDAAGHIPANKNITITDPITQGFANAVATGYPRPQSAEMGNYWGNFGDALNQVMDKGSDPVATVKSACAAMNKANKIP
jgi:arabinogalactan oligomer/maltooligosaccharide transport system substrate-binding protein